MSSITHYILTDERSVTHACTRTLELVVYCSVSPNILFRISAGLTISQNLCRIFFSRTPDFCSANEFYKFIRTAVQWKDGECQCMRLFSSGRKSSFQSEFNSVKVSCECFFVVDSLHTCSYNVLRCCFVS